MTRLADHSFGTKVPQSVYMREALDMLLRREGMLEERETANG